MDGVFFVTNTNEPLYIRLYDSIVEEIYNGNLKSEDKMPSIRQLSKSMNISRTTIESTYGQLVAEGFLYSKPQKGYYVMALDFSDHEKTLSPNITSTKSAIELTSDDGEIGLKKKNSNNKDQTVKEAKVYDFVSEYVEYANFDIGKWKKHINKVLLTQENELFRFSQAFGEEVLKEEIVKYFTRVRGIRANKDQLIIGAGTQSLLRGLSILLNNKQYKTLNIEDPGFELAKVVFKQSGINIKGIGLKNNVLDVSQLNKKTNQVLFTSPSYQFPFGEIMTIKTRHELLNWAKETNSYIIEDDYNSELRYIGKPIPSLQGMDTHSRVIYLGSFSTLLLPSIRISFMVLPKELSREYQTSFRNRVQSASKLEQLALANMLKSGDFAKHIRKINKNYRAKHKKLLFYIDKYLVDLAEVELPPAGSSAIITLTKEVEISDIKEYSKDLNLKIAVLSDFLIKKSSKLLEKKLVLNYRGINEYDMENAIIKLKELICQLY